MKKGFVKGMVLGAMAGVAVGAATEMCKTGGFKKNKMINKGKKFVNDLMN